MECHARFHFKIDYANLNKSTFQWQNTVNALLTCLELIQMHSFSQQSASHIKISMAAETTEISVIIL